MRKRWDSTLWLLLRVAMARLLAVIPAALFLNDFNAVVARVGLAAPIALPSQLPTAGSLAAGMALTLAGIAAPFVWVWPIGRFLDLQEEDLRAVAVRRFEGVNGFFLCFFAAEAALGILAAGQWRRPWLEALLIQGFGAYYSAYFTLLTLEPLLFKDLARYLHTGRAVYDRKRGPMWTVHTKLLLLVLNLIVIPMALVGASMRLGLGGYSQGLGVAIATAVVAVGYGEMLYRSLARPLAGLNEKMARVSAGDYSAKASVLAGDEVGQLRWRFNEMVEGLEERERLKDTFGRFVSVEVAKRLIASKEISLGGESIEATVLFSDIRDFTPLSESLSPQELVTFLNDYFASVAEPIPLHNGVVNKFIGDAVMAIFAPSFGSIDHAGDALRAALEMRRRLAEFNRARPGPPVRSGVGLHTGLLVAGNIGTAKRMEYTVIGDTVNAAARIESQTKELGCDLLISDSVYSRLDEATRRGLDAQRCEGVRVKGKETALVLYKIG